MSREPGQLASSRLQSLSSSGEKRHSAEQKNAPQQLMLDLRFRDGSRRALPYSYLISIGIEVSTNADSVLVLQFASHSVRIEGRNLGLLYDRMLTHSLGLVQEAERPEFDDTPDSGWFVSRIRLGDVE